MYKVLFNNKENAFFSALRKKADSYFAVNNLKTTGDYRLYTKAVILGVSAVFLYTVLLFFTPPAWLSLILCAVLGLNLAAIGFNIMHDAAHGSFSSKPWVNELMGLSLNLIGGNVYLWKMKHNVMHHTYTNISGMDEDINLEPWMRVHSSQPRRWYHRFQFIYWVFLYGFTYLMWVFAGDFSKYFSGKIEKMPFRKMSLKENIIFWVSKIFYVSVFLVLPILKLGFWPAIAGYLIMSFVCGFAIAVVFQLAHLTEYTQVPELSEQTPESGKINQSWGLHEVETTANFATANKFVIWITGGLNFQVEHHLFPRISHVFYPELRKLVKEVCRDFNVQYKEFPTFFQALVSHVAYLKRLGS
jgi:linoleoyl-CoA desaturase